MPHDLHRTPHSHSLRIGRTSLENHYYHVTFSTLGRKPIFSSLVVARKLVCVLHRVGRAETLCFVVMPDHVHWLLCLKKGAELSRCVKSAKSYSARCINELRGMRGSVWQPGFHDHAIRGEKNLRAVARYIVANPVRAGLVDRVADYPHWDAAWL